MFRFIALSVLFLTIFTIISAEYIVPMRNIRGDVPSVFFSPFRMIGKRSPFYGLYKQMDSAERIN